MNDDDTLDHVLLSELAPEATTEVAALPYKEPEDALFLQIWAAAIGVLLTIICGLGVLLMEELGRTAEAERRIQEIPFPPAPGTSVPWAELPTPQMLFESAPVD